MIVLGYLAAVLIPVLGVLAGIIIVRRPGRSATRHGAWIIAIAIAVGAASLALATNDHAARSQQQQQVQPAPNIVPAPLPGLTPAEQREIEKAYEQTR